MSLYDTPSLDALSGDARAAWLWDTDRLRIVWSNDAGLAFWGAESLFDVLDRRFDASEPGVDRLVHIARAIAQNTTVEEDFAFPSSGRRGTIRCRCALQSLADGRTGLLMIAESGRRTDRAAGPAELSADALPVAVAQFDMTGLLLGANRAAGEIFETARDGMPAADLSLLLGDSEAAAEFAGRVAEAGVVSETRTISTRYGDRVHRLTARHVTGERPGEDGTIAIVFDDITERRGLERNLRENNDRLADFVAAAADFTWELDADLTWKDVSSGFEQATGLDSRDLLGRSWQDTANRFGCDADGRILAACRARKAWRTATDWSADGATVTIILSATPAHDAHGAFRGYRGVGTARIAAEAARDNDERRAGDVSEDDVNPEDRGGLDETDRRTFRQIRDEVNHRANRAETNEETATGQGEAKPDTDGDTHDVAATDTGSDSEAAAPAIPAEQAHDVISEEAAEPGETDQVAEDEAVTDKPAPDAELLGPVLAGLPYPVLVTRADTAVFANAAAKALFMSGEDTEQDFPVPIDTIFMHDDAASGELSRLDPEKPEDVAARSGLEIKSGPDGSERFRAMLGTIGWDGAPAVLVALAQVVEPVLPAAGEPSVGAREAELQSMLDTATDGILTLDSQGGIVSLNSSAEAIFGYDKAEIAGRSLAELMTAESAAAVTDYVASLTDSGLASIFNDGREVVALEKNGGEIPLFLTLGRMNGERTGADAPARLCAVVRDITHWKKAEADLRKAKDAAEQASIQKSEFLAKISHELRTPLNAIIGFSEVMTAEKFGPLANDRYKGYINDIHSSGEHLLSLINDLLDLSKVEAGKMELNFTSVNLADIVGQCISIMQPQANRERIIIRSSLATDLPPVVADQRSMRQIVLNVLSNAIKFTDAGGQVIVSGLTDDGGRVQIRVKDTGIGMNEDELKTALEPFRQIRKSGRPDQVGTGLGLPLTKALTEANRAEFSIESQPDHGTLVQITFPTTRVLAD